MSQADKVPKRKFTVASYELKAEKSEPVNVAEMDQEQLRENKCKSYDPGWTFPPFDARYPQQNQMKYCLNSYMDYHRCLKIKGEDETDCCYFRKCYEGKCNTKLVETLENQRMNGVLNYNFGDEQSQ